MDGIVRPLRASVFLLAACGLAATAAGPRPALAASAPGDVLQAGRPGAELTLVAGGDRLELPGGAVARLEIPAGGAASALAALADGWAVAGSRGDGAGGRRLFFLRGHGDRGRPLPAPAGQRVAVRQDPVLLVDGGRLVGAAWLEGDPARPLAVAAAAWDGTRWSAPERVAPPAPGSQLALAGTVLGDGSWLLVWSAFDGADDEIVWARRVGGSWLAPSLLSADNRVPDVTPGLTAVDGGGAVVAWSRYDGRSYRLRTARFAGGEWRDERWAAGAGSLFPSFAGTGERPWLLYFDASDAAAGGSGGWTVAELDRDAGVRRRWQTGATPDPRPAVLAAGGDEPLLAWSAEAGVAARRVRLRAVGGGEEAGP